jgi:hypothetical protein
MITFYGASDDLVEVEGCKGADEFSTYEGKLHQIAWQGDLVGPDGSQMRVFAYYDGCWAFGVGQVDEDVELPPWRLSLSQGGPLTAEAAHPTSAYSVVLSVDAPEATRLTNVWPTGGDS